MRKGGGGKVNYVYIHLYTHKKRKPKSALKNKVHKLILDRRSCEKLHKKLGLPNPVFITSGIYISTTLFLKR